MELIHDIETLRTYVKLNASTDWDTYRPFLRDAQEKYIAPYFGQALLDTIRNNDSDMLRERILRALGPFSLALATHEMSINFGESGHTVTRTDKLAPASDAKIKQATESLLERGWHNLDSALRHVSINASKYPTWEENNRMMGTALFGNYKEFQDDGLIDINYSPLTFSRLRMLIKRIEQSEVLLMIPSDIEYSEAPKLMSAMQAYTASRVAELYTNSTTDKSLKDNPPIQFISDGSDNTGNYYAQQSAYWSGVVSSILIEEHGQEDPNTIKWNEQSKKVFIANAGGAES